MTTLYLYFPDLGELVLAVMIRVMDSAGAEFEDQLRTRWPDASLEACCHEYLLAHHEFWVRHARVLHMRNKFTDANDLRFVDYSNKISVPIVRLFIQQMDGDPEIPNTPIYGVGTILLIILERLASAVTNATFFWAIRRTGVTDEAAFVKLLLKAEADVMANTIRHQREIARANREQPAKRRARA
jgi:AcrR family transcriptional regulator